MEHIYRSFHDLFYKYKCYNGYIDPSDKDYYCFRKKDKIFAIRRYGEEDIRFRLLDSNHFDSEGEYIIIKSIVFKTIEEANIEIEKILKETR